MIEIKDLSKTFSSASGTVEALRDINLTINDGEIFGIIGLSGAGKSTLVRCINLLERPTSGHVIIDGKDMTVLPRRELLEMRRSISMIFRSMLSSLWSMCRTPFCGISEICVSVPVSLWNRCISILSILHMLSQHKKRLYKNKRNTINSLKN